MTILYLVVPLALVLVGAGVVGYLWAVKNGQMDDLDTPGIRVIRDEQ
jgi:cbb3-type cytochrome oxidase maturation protein